MTGISFSDLVWPQKKKPDWDFPPEIRAIWRTAPNLTPCPRFRRVSTDKFFAHLKKERCERCLAVWQQSEKESELIAFLMRNRN